MGDGLPRWDPMELRAALRESEVAEFEGFDDELIDDIATAVIAWTRSEKDEGAEEVDWTGEPGFDRGWAEAESPPDQNRQAERILEAIWGLEAALRECSPSQRAALESVYRSLMVEAAPSKRVPPPGKCLDLLRNDLQRLSSAAGSTKGRGGKAPDPSTQITREVAYAIKTFGDHRQESQSVPDSDGFEHEYPPLQRGTHLAETIRDVMKVIGLPTALRDTNLQRYARKGPKWLIDRSG